MLRARFSIALFVALLGLVSQGNAFDMDDWAQRWPTMPEDDDRGSKNHGASSAEPTQPSEKKDEADSSSSTESKGSEDAQKDVKEHSSQTNSEGQSEKESESHDTSDESSSAAGKTDQPKIQVPHDDSEHAKLVSTKEYETSEQDKKAHESALPIEAVQASPTVESAPAASTDVTSLIPNTLAEEHTASPSNESTLINDTTKMSHNMRVDTITKIDETIEKLDRRLQKFLDAVSVSAHDLSYYQKLLNTAYDTFCKEINGDLGHLEAMDTKGPNGKTPVNVIISAEMSSAIRRSFDTKVEVLELAASEVATQKSKETGARTIHDALTSGLLQVRSTIASPGLTIKSANSEMKTMTAIVEDMTKTLEADIITWTLKQDSSKKRLFDKIVERDEYMKTHSMDHARVETFTQEIRTLAGEFHKAQTERVDAVQKQNGFKEYMDEMHEDINTIQRLIDTYFATVHNGHAKAILQEAETELHKDGKAESELRLRLAEEKVRSETLLAAETVADHLPCPTNYRPLHPEKPISNLNPCVRMDRWAASR